MAPDATLRLFSSVLESLKVVYVMFRPSFLRLPQISQSQTGSLASHPAFCYFYCLWIETVHNKKQSLHMYTNNKQRNSSCFQQSNREINKHSWMIWAQMLVCLFLHPLILDQTSWHLQALGYLNMFPIGQHYPRDICPTVDGTQRKLCLLKQIKTGTCGRGQQDKHYWACSVGYTTKT